MRSMLPLLLLAAGLSASGQRYVEAPDVPAETPNSDYPLHIHIFGVHWTHTNGGYQGYGRADLLGPPREGVDYTFSCSEPFLHNVHGSEFYQARWKKPNQKLEILMQKVGSDHLQHCELMVSIKTEPYGRPGGGTPPAGTATSPAPQPQQ